MPFQLSCTNGIDSTPLCADHFLVSLPQGIAHWT